jgi:hypothetical protein
MEGMGKHMARRHPAEQGKQQVKLMLCLVSPLKMTIEYDISLNEVKFMVRPCKVMMTRLKECGFCGVLGCVTQHLVISSDSE